MGYETNQISSETVEKLSGAFRAGREGTDKEGNPLDLIMIGRNATMAAV